MATVRGIGGVFFKCRDKASLTAWYQEHLGIPLNELSGCDFKIEELPEKAFCVWGPFQDDTEYFQPSHKEFMINLIVDDVPTALEQVVAGGAETVGEIESYDYGVFGWFMDPEGNKIELWQPR